MKKTLALILSTCLLLGLLAGCSQAPDTTKASTSSPTTAAPTTEPLIGSAKLCEDIKQFMEQQGNPKCYGGCYVDMDADAVVILATNTRETEKLLKDILKDCDKDDYSITKVSTSYAKLLSAQQKVYDSMDIWTAMDVQIAEVTIDLRNSCVSVGVVDLNAGNTKAVKEMVPDPLVTFYNVPSDTLD